MRRRRWRIVASLAVGVLVLGTLLALLSPVAPGSGLATLVTGGGSRGERSEAGPPGPQAAPTSGGAAVAPTTGRVGPSAAGLATVFALATSVAPVATPEPLPTPTSTVPVPAVSPAPRSPVAVGASPGATVAFHVLLDETFPGAPPGWPNDPQGVAHGLSGYRLSVPQNGQFTAVDAPLASRPRDLIVAAALHKVGGPDGGTYGLIVRDEGPGPRDGTNQSGRFYVFVVSDRGHVGVWRRDGEQWIEVTPWTASAAVHQGTEPNLLAVGALGPLLAFLVNGQEVAEPRDANLSEGGVGVFVGGDLNDVLLERLIVLGPNQ
jgi:hypothetical protein